MKRVLVLCVFSMLATCFVAEAAILAYEGFEYDPGLTLAGQNGGTGFAGGWSLQDWGGAETNATISDGSMQFANIVSNGNSTTRSTNGRNYRVLDTPYGADGTTVYFSFFQEVEAVGPYYAVELFKTVLDDNDRALSICNFGAYMAGSNRNNSWMSLGDENTDTNFFVIKFSFGQGNLDTVAVFRNPDPDAGEPGAATVTMAVGDYSFDTIAVFSNAPVVQQVDEIRFGESWGDVVPSRSFALNPAPEDNAVGVQLDENTLSWSEPSSAPGATYDVSFGTDPDQLVLLEEDYAGTSLAVTLDYDTRYFWRVDTNYAGNTDEGFLWSFTSAGIAYDPDPANGYDGVLDVELSWMAEDYHKSFDVYFGTDPNSIDFIGNTTVANSSGLILPEISDFTTYYWQVNAYDQSDVLIVGDAWSFTTGGIIGHWTFDGDPNDSSDNNRDGTGYGDLEYVSGMDDEAVKLDNEDYIELEHFDRPDVMTIMAWIKTDSESDGEIIGWGGSGPNFQLFVSPTGILTYGEWDGAAWLPTESATPVNDGVWHHVAVTRDGGADIKIYVDGRLNGSGAAHGALPGSTSHLNIGVLGHDWGYQSYFNGMIDDLWVYSGIVDAADIKAVYDNSGAAINPVPENFAEDVNPFNVTLDWDSLTGSTYDVYLGTDPNYQPLAAGGISTSTHLTGDLDIDSTYYWRVDIDSSIKGAVWHFTTQGPTPADGQIAVQPWDDLLLIWPANPNAESYNLYVGTDPNSMHLSGNTTDADSRAWDFSGLAEDTEYSWQVEALDGSSSVIWSSPVWSFTTDGGLPDPLAHWKFDGDPNDSSVNGRDGTATGSPSYVDGVIGQAVELEEGEYFEVPHFDRPDVMTIMAWVNPAKDGDILCWSGNHGYEFAVTVGQLLYGEWDNSSWLDNMSGVSLPFGEWHHIAVVRDSQSNTMLYIDGEFVSSAPMHPFIPDATNVLNIGTFYNGSKNSYAGLIDDLAVYTKALSDTHIKYAYNLRCDSDADGDVDLSDFARVSSGWLSTGTVWGDFNFDDEVDTVDFVIFAEAWLANYK